MIGALHSVTNTFRGQNYIEWPNLRVWFVCSFLMFHLCIPTNASHEQRLHIARNFSKIRKTNSFWFQIKATNSILLLVLESIFHTRHGVDLNAVSLRGALKIKKKYKHFTQPCFLCVLGDINGSWPTPTQRLDVSFHDLFPSCYTLPTTRHFRLKWLTP